MERYLLVLGQEVLLHEDVSQRVFSLSGVYQFLEEFTEAIIVDKVSTDAQLLDLAFRIGNDSVNDCFETSDSDSVMTNVDKPQGFIYFESFTKCSGTVDVNDVPVEVDRLQDVVFLQSSGEDLGSRNTHLTF
jgi:hypothetical protein